MTDGRGGGRRKCLCNSFQSCSQPHCEKHTWVRPDDLITVCDGCDRKFVKYKYATHKTMALLLLLFILAVVLAVILALVIPRPDPTQALGKAVKVGAAV